ncbi:MAG: ferredoxin [Mycobacteriales bacterium]
MRVAVDIDRCCGSGQCALTVPEVFDQSQETGLVILLDAEPPAGLRPDLEYAADRCPSQALTLLD